MAFGGYSKGLLNGDMNQSYSPLTNSITEELF